MIKREELTNPNSCMSRAKDDELTFVLLERDIAAPVAIRKWIEERIRLGKNGPNDPQLMEAMEWVQEVESSRAEVGADPEQIARLSAERKAYDIGGTVMNADKDWLNKMAALEDGCLVSVGGLVTDIEEREMARHEDEHAKLLERLCAPGSVPPEYDALLSEIDRLKAELSEAQSLNWNHEAELERRAAALSVATRALEEIRLLADAPWKREDAYLEQNDGRGYTVGLVLAPELYKILYKSLSNPAIAQEAARIRSLEEENVRLLEIFLKENRRWELLEEVAEAAQKLRGGFKDTPVEGSNKLWRILFEDDPEALGLFEKLENLAALDAAVTK